MEVDSGLLTLAGILSCCVSLLIVAGGCGIVWWWLRHSRRSLIVLAVAAILYGPLLLIAIGMPVLALAFWMGWVSP